MDKKIAYGPCHVRTGESFYCSKYCEEKFCWKNTLGKSFSESCIELTKASIEATKQGTGGIVLNNKDPKADYLALVAKNSKILKKCGLSMKRKVEAKNDGSINLILVLSHLPSGEFSKSEVPIPKKKYAPALNEDSDDVYFMSRHLYEGLLGIASSNDAIEADLYGPRRGYRELEAPYDKTADYIYFEMSDHTGKIYKKKVDRRKFERLAYGVTSEEEEEIVPVVPQTINISWSNIALFLRCRRCFYYLKKFKIKLNLFGQNAFGLEKLVDDHLKRLFDNYRKDKRSHPILSETKATRFLKHHKIDTWRKAWNPENGYKIDGIQFEDVWQNYMVYGGVDDVWINDKKELIVVDYKVTNRQKPKVYDEYKKQLEFYAWIFEKNNYTTADVSYLFFLKPTLKQDLSNWTLQFEPEIIEHIIDSSWVEKTIYSALDCLNKNEIPVSGNQMINNGKPCEACQYVEKIINVIKEIS